MWNAKGLVPGIMLLAALLVVGCGGNSGESTAASAEVTAMNKRQFVSRAEAACKKADVEQEALLGKALEGRTGNGPMTPAEQSSLVRDAAAPPLDQEARSISELAPPRQEKDQVEAFVKAIETATEQIEKEPAALLGGESTAFKSAERLAGALKLNGCGAP